MIFIVLALVALAAAQPLGPGSGDAKCDLQGDLAILLDPAVDEETFEMMKRSALNAVLTLNLRNSSVGIWQTTSPPKIEMAMGPASQENVIRAFEDISHDATRQARGAAESLYQAAKSLASVTDMSGVGKEKAILYVAGSTIDASVLQAAEDVRAQGVSIWAIAVGMEGEELEDLFALAGGSERVYQIPSRPASGATTRALQQWFCRVADDEFSVNDDLIGDIRRFIEVVRDGIVYEGLARRKCFVSEFGEVVCNLEGCLVSGRGGRLCGPSVFTGSDPIVIID